MRHLFFASLLSLGIFSAVSEAAQTGKRIGDKLEENPTKKQKMGPREEFGEVFWKLMTLNKEMPSLVDDLLKSIANLGGAALKAGGKADDNGDTPRQAYQQLLSAMNQCPDLIRDLALCYQTDFRASDAEIKELKKKCQNSEEGIESLKNAHDSEKGALRQECEELRKGSEELVRVHSSKYADWQKDNQSLRQENSTLSARLDTETNKVWLWDSHCRRIQDQHEEEIRRVNLEQQRLIESNNYLTQQNAYQEIVLKANSRDLVQPPPIVRPSVKTVSSGLTAPMLVSSSTTTTTPTSTNGRSIDPKSSSTSQQIVPRTYEWSWDTMIPPKPPIHNSGTSPTQAAPTLPRITENSNSAGQQGLATAATSGDELRTPDPELVPLQAIEVTEQTIVLPNDTIEKAKKVIASGMTEAKASGNTALIIDSQLEKTPWAKIGTDLDWSSFSDLTFKGIFTGFHKVIMGKIKHVQHLCLSMPVVGKMMENIVWENLTVLQFNDLSPAELQSLLSSLAGNKFNALKLKKLLIKTSVTVQDGKRNDFNDSLEDSTIKQICRKFALESFIFNGSEMANND